MSRGNGDNSWYKYLESAEGRTTSTASTQTDGDIIEKTVGRNFPQDGVCLLDYQCSICMNHILEVWVEKCEHESCANCVPRSNCPEKCKPWLIHSLCEENLIYQPEIIEQFKSAMGLKTVTIRGLKKKRKEREFDGDEMSE